MEKEKVGKVSGPIMYGEAMLAPSEIVLQEGCLWGALTLLLACLSACLVAFLSKPIDTNVDMASSDGSVSDDNKRKERSLASARRPVLGDIVPTMFLLGVGGEELLKVGKESREKNEANMRP
ncbi:Uncharacterized protein Rs2_35221 [Raphanus sativus]|nr:Uncharacterized protein Rs2_35221 [Raphanus sativus]